MELHPGQKQANVQAILNSMYSMSPILLLEKPTSGYIHVYKTALLINLILSSIYPCNRLPARLDVIRTKVIARFSNLSSEDRQWFGNRVL